MPPRAWDFQKAIDGAQASLEQLRAFRRPGARLAPSPPVAAFWRFPSIGGHMGSMREDRLSFLLDVRQEVGDVALLRFGWVHAHLLAHPDHVRHVLVDNHRNYDKQTRGFDRIRLILGNGLLTSEGDFWRRQRRIAQPAFLKERIAGFASVMADATREMLDRWSKLPEGQVVDVADEMMRLTLRIAGLTLLSTDPAREADVVGRSVTLLLREAHARILSPFAFLEALPLPKNLELRRALAELDRVVYDAIARRRSSTERPDDLLSMLMDARDEDSGEAMTDEQLRDEVLTMFLAGHETTANALSWTFYLLSKHPAQAREVAREVHEVLRGDAPSVEEVASLGATRRFLQETMRLYPPAWLIARRAVAEDAIGGFLIPRGSYVFVSPWVTHRHPDLFEDPEGFLPDRFLPENLAKLPKHAYFPFGAGPRLCIGQGFAMLEATLITAMVVKRFRLDLVPGHEVRPEPTITLRPRDGVRVSLHQTDRRHS